MRVTIIAPGSRGDVQPYVALGAGLARAGHLPRVVTTMDHRSLVESYRLELAEVPVSIQAALAARPVAASVESGSLMRSFRSFADIAARAARAISEVSLEASQDAEVVVVGLGGALVGDAVARRRRVPLVQAYNVPVTPTAAFPSALLPGLDQAPALRRLGHVLSRVAVWLTGRMSAAKAVHEVIGGPSPALVPGRWPGLVPGPVLYGFSPAFLPRGPEWGDDVEVTGFWFADEPPGFTPPGEVAEFLAAGPPPVCIGFGSMSQEDPHAVASMVLEAVERAKVRAILLAGWGGTAPERLPPEVLAIDGLPHAWLYPRCRAVVHHGGAGTTAAALRAGVPAVVVPFHGDQAFWARRVASAGAGARPLPRRALSGPALAARLEEVISRPEIIERAAGLGRAIRAEDGVAAAVTAIERLAGRAEKRFAAVG